MTEFRIIDSYFGQNEIIIENEQNLIIELNNILNRFENRVIILKSPNSGELIIGLGTPYGFVEYLENSGKPPYLIAGHLYEEEIDMYFEFDSGGTPTPIHSKNCLPISSVFEIATCFFKNKNLPKHIFWFESKFQLAKFGIFLKAISENNQRRHSCLR